MGGAVAELTPEELNTLLRAEAAKLGGNSEKRVAAVEDFLVAQLGEPAAKQMVSTLVTAQQVENFERLMAAHRTQGAGNSHREATKVPDVDAHGCVDEATFQKMSARERLDYVRQWPQEQFQPANGAGR
jgi:hypothetical protein